MIEKFTKYESPLLAGVLLPKIDVEHRHYKDLGVAENISSYDFLRRLCWKGIHDRGIDKFTNKQEYFDRVKRELETFKDLGFVEYVLLNWEVHDYCISKGIPKGFGRGSCSGSLVLYLINVTDVDPIKYNLFFERFVSKSRAKKIIVGDVTYLDGSLLADVDSDISYDRRQEVIKFIEEKHKGRTAKILTVGTLSSKLVLRECGKIVDALSEVDVNHISENVPKAFNIPLDIDKALEESEKLRELSGKYPNTFKIAKKLEGLIKNTGVHASGIAISAMPLEDVMPVQCTKDGELISGFEMNDVASLAVKFDILGLKTLTVVDDCCKQLGMTMKDFDPNDETSYWPFQNLIAPQGLFQIETDATYKVCQKVKPRNLGHLAAVNGISRPGAMQFADKYAKYVETGESQSPHPFLDSVFQSTGGNCLDGDSQVFCLNENKFLKIKDLKKGDKISSLNEGTYDFETDEVVEMRKTGFKEIFRVHLRDGSFIDSTKDHLFLTERGWVDLENAINNKCHLAISIKQDRDESKAKSFNRDKLLILGYLLADGCIGQGSQASFVSVDEEMISRYCDALNSFDNLTYTKVMQIRNVTRISAKQRVWEYHKPNALTEWLRELNLKHPHSRILKQGKTSGNKFIPDFIYSLNKDDIGFFLAAMFDCDGGESKHAVYYKTISKDLAYGISRLLRILEVEHSIYQSPYSCTRGDRIAYQITMPNKADLKDKIIRFSIKLKRKFSFDENKRQMGYSYDRSILIDEANQTYGSNWSQRKSFYLDLGKRDKNILRGINRSKRLNCFTARHVSSQTNVPNFRKNCKLYFSEIHKVESLGEKDVYDIQVKNNHNFIANGIICHNCIFQEQILRALNKVGFDLETCETIRKIIGKKLVDKMPEWEQKLKEKVAENGLDKEVAEILWKVMSDSANYQFAEVHAISYSMLTYATMWLKFNHPKEFFLSLLKMATFEQDTFAEINKISQELSLFGITLLPPDLSKSGADFQIEGKNIRYGLLCVKGISEKTIAPLLSFSDKTFSNKYEVFQEAKSAGLSIGVLCALIQAGCLDSFGGERCRLVLEAQMFNKLSEKQKLFVMEAGEIHNYDIFAALKDAKEGKIVNDKGKSVFTDKSIEKLRADHANYKKIYDQNQKHLKFCNWYFERKLLGYSYSHTLREVFEDPKESFTPLLEFSSLDDKQEVRIVGVVTETKEAKSKKDNNYLRMDISDDGGRVTALMMDNAREKKWSNYKESGLPKPKEESIVVCVGKKFGDVLMVDKMELMEERIAMKLSETK